MRWGWTRKIEGSQRLLLHSRSESVSRRTIFFEAFQRRRCEVLLTAWMEPQQGANGRPRPGRWPPWVVIPADSEAVAVAALWEGVDGGRVVLMTTAACPITAQPRKSRCLGAIPKPKPLPTPGRTRKPSALFRGALCGHCVAKRLVWLMSRNEKPRVSPGFSCQSLERETQQS